MPFGLHCCHMCHLSNDNNNDNHNKSGSSSSSSNPIYSWLIAVVCLQCGLYTVHILVCLLLFLFLLSSLIHLLFVHCPSTSIITTPTPNLFHTSYPCSSTHATMLLILYHHFSGLLETLGLSSSFELCQHSRMRSVMANVQVHTLLHTWVLLVLDITTLAWIENFHLFIYSCSVVFEKKWFYHWRHWRAKPYHLLMKNSLV